MIDPVTGAILGEIGGQLLGGLFGGSSAKKQNKAAAAAAERQYQQTKEMMQSRHQWEVADLRAAGLNPILSAGAAPSMGSSAVAPVVDEGAAYASSARSAGRAGVVAQELKNMRASQQLLEAQASSARAQAALNSAQTTSVQVDTADKAGRKKADLDIMAHMAQGAAGLSRNFLDPARKNWQELGTILKNKFGGKK